MDRYMYFSLILLYVAVNLIRSTKGDVCNFDPRCQCSTSSITCQLGNSTVLPQIHFIGSYIVNIRMENAKEVKSIDAMFLSGVTLPYGKIITLLLRNNGIDSIHCSAFLGQEYTLYYLYLQYNKLATVPECALKGMVGLRQLGLYGNKISRINSHAFVTLKNLTILDLGGNRIDSIECSTFVGLENKLAYLDLSRNNLSEVPECALKRLIGLRTLVLGGNKISSINGHAFVTLKNLNSLYLSGNRIDSVHCFAFVGLENKLAYLNLSGNNLDEVPQCALTMLTKLYTLHLYDNNIHYLGRYAFANLTNLRILRLDRNKIIAIDNYAFYELNRTLYELNLENNNISSVLFGFANLTNVQYLYLRNNQLSEFTMDLKYFPNLLYLDVSFNRLRVLNIEGEFKDGITLLASHNYLTAMPFLRFQVKQYYYYNNYFSIDFSRNNMTTLSKHQMLFEQYNSYRRIFIMLTLTLSDNSINIIHPNFMQFNGSRDTGDFARVYLHISKNAINKISFLKSANLLFQYQYVDLRDNKIMQVSENNFKLITNQNVELSRLYLGGNPLKCDCDLFWMRNNSYSSIYMYLGSPPPTCASPPNMKDYLATCFPASCDELDLTSPPTCARVTTTTTGTITTTTTMPSITVPHLTMDTPAIENSTISNATTHTFENSTPKKILMEASSQDSNSDLLVSLLCVSLVVLVLVTVFLCLLWRRSAVPFKWSSIKLIILPGGNQHPPALDTQLNTINAESTSANRVNDNTRINAEATNVYENEAAMANTASGQEITADDLGQYIQLDKSTSKPSDVYDQLQNDQELYENIRKREQLYKNL